MIEPVYRITSEVGTKYIEKDHFLAHVDNKAEELKFLPTGAEFQEAECDEVPRLESGWYHEYASSSNKRTFRR